MPSSIHPPPPPLCLTIGDPTGIGPEITACWLAEVYPQHPFSLKIYGDIDGLKATAKHFGWRLPHPEKSQVEYVRLPEAGKHPGEIAYRAVEAAVAEIASGHGRGLVTGPISKAHLWQAGFEYPGHTELLAQLTNHYFVRQHQHHAFVAEMLFQYEAFRVMLLTRHIPLSSVPEHLTVEGITHSLKTLVQYLQQVEGITTPRLCLLGVNPHAGEIGGHEEETLLIPARDQVMRETEAYITLPMAADGVFRGFDALHPPYHAYIAPTHDQGLIPMKLLGGFEAVNVTIGLPFVRTSVSHGMAVELVGTGTANISGLRTAVELAHHLTRPHAIQPSPKPYATTPQRRYSSLNKTGLAVSPSPSSPG